MKKKLSYRDKLIELAYIYDVKEIKDYVSSRKSLTTGQLELILKKKFIFQTLTDFSFFMPTDSTTRVFYCFINIYVNIHNLKRSISKFFIILK